MSFTPGKDRLHLSLRLRAPVPDRRDARPAFQELPIQKQSRFPHANNANEAGDQIQRKHPFFKI